MLSGNVGSNRAVTAGSVVTDDASHYCCVVLPVGIICRLLKYNSERVYESSKVGFSSFSNYTHTQTERILLLLFLLI